MPALVAAAALLLHPPGHAPGMALPAADRGGSALAPRRGDGRTSAAKRAEDQPRRGTLTLDLDDPVVTMAVAGVPLRLRVDLDGRGTVELNPAAAARLPVTWEDGGDAGLGGVTLPGRQATAVLAVDGRAVRVTLSIHGRDCCAGSDGAVGPLQLPYEQVRWVRAGAAAVVSTRYAMADDDADGLTVAQGAVRVQASIGQAQSMATKAAAVLLSDAQGGRYDGPYARAAGPWGVERPVRPVAFGRPPVLLGFAVPRVIVRTGDYGGGLAMPEDRARPGDLLVQRRVKKQLRRPVVVIARDLLRACTSIALHVPTLALDLACPAAGAPAGGG